MNLEIEKKKKSFFSVIEKDLFRLYILFSQYKSCDNTQEDWFFVLLIKQRMQAWICLHALFSINKRKDWTSWVLSHDLWWENTMYNKLQ